MSERDMTPMEAAIWKEAQCIGKHYPVSFRDDIVQEAVLAGLERLRRGGATMDFIKKNMREAVKRYYRKERRWMAHRRLPEDI